MHHRPYALLYHILKHAPVHTDSPFQYCFGIPVLWSTVASDRTHDPNFLLNKHDEFQQELLKHILFKNVLMTPS